MNPIQFRRHLHMHPELSFREHDTAAFISARLSELGIEHRPIAGTGVLAKIEGRGKADPKRRAVVLRADIDALPIDERNDADWSSRNQGVMHACGHDMHAAVLFGVLKTFAEAPDFRGTLFGLFQPGEECNPGGASLVLAEKPFEGYDVRAVVGEHVEPQLEVGTLGFRAGKYMAASDELRFRVRGTGGHGAMRKQLKDPVAAGAELLTRLIALNGEECVLSIGRVEAGGATNIVPDQVYLEGTLRTFDEREREIIHKRIRNFAADIDKRHGVRTDVDISRGYPCVVNDAALVKHAAALAAEAGLRVEMLPLRTTAEDIVDRMAEELAESDFKPVAFELGFGGRDGTLPAITIQEGDATLSVSGKVDRVDGWLHDGKLYLRVVDYKTGRKSFDLSDVRYGLGIQMLLYLFTLEKEGQSCFGYPIVPAGVLYHPARDLILKADRDITPEALRRAMDRELRRDGMVLGDPEVLRAMEHSALEAPCFLPIQVSRDGGISGGVATAAQLGRLGQYVEKLLHQIIRELRQGNIDADPCWRGPQESACTYCDFASACHFQDGQAGDRLRPLKRVKPDEFWEFVAHETGEEGRHGEL